MGSSDFQREASPVKFAEWKPKEFIQKKSQLNTIGSSKNNLLGLRYIEDIRSLGFVAYWYAQLFILWLWGEKIVTLGGWSDPNLPQLLFRLNIPYTSLGITLIDFHYTKLGLLAYFLMWAQNMFLSFTSSIITHNAVHTQIFFNDTANEIIKLALGFMYGIPVSIFLPTHNLSHHKYTQMRKDVSRTYKVRHSWNLLNFLHYPYMWYSASIPSNIQYFKAQYARGRPIWYQFKFQAQFLVLFSIIGMVFSIPKFLLLIFLPQQFAQQCIGWTTLMQHDGMDLDLLGFNHSRNFTGNVYNWLLCNAGYHTIHHMYPGIHWSRLKDLHDEKVEPYIHPGCNEKNNLSFWFRYFIYPGIRHGLDGKPWVLPESGEDEDWFFDTAETYSSTKFEYEAWAPEDKDLKRAQALARKKMEEKWAKHHSQEALEVVESKKN